MKPWRVVCEVEALAEVFEFEDYREALAFARAGVVNGVDDPCAAAELLDFEERVLWTSRERFEPRHGIGAVGAGFYRWSEGLGWAAV